jgi:hypothetical protein
MVEGESSPKEYLKFVLVILTITFISLLFNNKYGTSSPMEYMRWFMGVFFLVFASFKLIGYQMFALMFAGYDIVAKRFKLYAYLYPFIELGLAILYLTNALPTTRDVLTVIIMGVGSIGVFQEIKKRSGIHCACLGNVIKLPLSTVSLVEDVGMGLMALTILLLR